MKNLRPSLMIALALLLTVSLPALAQPTAERALDTSDSSVNRQILGACSGDVVLLQPPNQSNGIFSDPDCDFCGGGAGGAQILAEDFILAAETTITELTLWTGYFPNNVPLVTDAFSVIFHDDAAGLPGAIISTENNVPSSRTTTGVVLFGVDEYEHVLTLANPVTLAAGTYWVEIYNDSTGSTESVFWEVGDLDPVNGRLNNAFALEFPATNWLAGNPVGDSALIMCAMAEPPPNPLEVPTLGQYGMLALLLSLMGMGLVVLRRR